MRVFWKSVAIVFAFLIVPSFANAQVDPYLKQKLDQIFNTSVVIESESSTGSGFTVFSAEVGPVGKKRIETFIVTNHHVVRSSIEDKMPVQVGFKQYDSDFRETGILNKMAFVFAYDEEHDLALLRLSDHENKIPYVARVAPVGVKLQLMEHVWTVGATFGEPPLPSEGMVANKDVYMKGGTRYIRTQMYANRGNSGGALFHFDLERGYEVVGVVSAIALFAESSSKKLKKVHPTDVSKDEESKPEDALSGRRMKTEGNISYSIPPEILQQFLFEQQFKFRRMGVEINFFK